MVLTGINGSNNYEEQFYVVIHLEKYDSEKLRSTVLLTSTRKVNMYIFHL